MSAVVVNPCDAQDERTAAGIVETAFVITCNDSVEAVVLGTLAQAKTIRDRLSNEYFTKKRSAFLQAGLTPEEVYLVRCHWAARPKRILRGDSQ